MASGVVEVVALLGSIKGGFRRSCAARAVVNQVAAAVEDKPGPAQEIGLKSCGFQGQYAALIAGRFGGFSKDFHAFAYVVKKPTRNMTTSATFRALSPI